MSEPQPVASEPDSVRPRIPLSRYLRIGRMLLRHARPPRPAGDGLEAAAVAAGPRVAPRGGRSTPAGNRSLAADLEALGPTFVKLGQLLSTRPDLVPPEQIAELARLQDKVEPFDFAEVRAIVESELGARLTRVFREFEEKPLAAASLGQVHRATLRDGRVVAVKVQRPAVREAVAADLAALERAARLLDRHVRAAAGRRFRELLDEFRRSLARELDYRTEARNLDQLADIVAPYPALVVPRPVHGLVRQRVLAMDYVRGLKITELGPVPRLDLDGRDLADQLFRAYLEQIFSAGFFHADPHPGNVLITDDNRLALVDVGMVGTLGGDLREKLVRFVLALGQGRAQEVAALLDALAHRGDDPRPELFQEAVAKLVDRHLASTVGELPLGRIVLEVFRAAAAASLFLPVELALLGKALVQLDEIGRTLDPEFDSNAAIRRHAAALAGRRLRDRVTVGGLAAAVNEAAEFAEQLPARANRILQRIADNDLSVRIDAIDHQLLMRGAQKIANRITVGLLLAALIVGAALLMRVQTRFQIFGYPGLAMLCFLAAAGGGFWLVASILWGDASDSRPSSPARTSQPPR